MRTIYEAGKGKWHIKGYLGYSASKQKAVQRLYETRKHAHPTRTFAKILSEDTVESKAGLGNRLLAGTFMSSFKKAINHYFKAKEFRREAVIRGKQQQKLGKYI